jgi:hypothetical protein
MILYVCPKCGRWQDHSLTEALGHAMHAFSLSLNGKATPTPALVVLCPEHGAMRRVEANEKLFVQADTAEKPPHPGELASRWGPNAHATVELHHDLVTHFTSVRISGGHGGYDSTEIFLDPEQALSLLTWLEQEKTTLAQMVAEKR